MVCIFIVLIALIASVVPCRDDYCVASFYSDKLLMKMDSYVDGLEVLKFQQQIIKQSNIYQLVSLFWMKK